MAFKTRSVFVIGALAALMSSAVLASGSDSFSAAPTGDTRLYNAGKGVYADKLSCSSCPLAGKSLDTELAKQVLSGKPQIALSADEQSALTLYLKRRFRI